MAENSSEKKPGGPLHVLTRWFKRAAPEPTSSASLAVARPSGTPPTKVGHYTIVRTLGQGGMGVVYEARNEILRRSVALKTMTNLGSDPAARERFLREARAAASVNHSNVCQVYEVVEHEGELFIAMELLRGEALDERLRRGPLSVSEALPVALDMLAALGALHARGIVHRDLKPSNVFLTADGTKVLDFGLVRTTDAEFARSLGPVTDLTATGMMMGTPRYMSPELVTGEAVDARSDLFAAGAILFEMLAGRPAFGGRNVVEVLHATLHEQPPALTGSHAVAAVDRVIRRALAKRPADRPPSAKVMADALRAVHGAFADDTPALARALTRLVVLPFRVLRSDPETDFLAFSLPDAIATSLSRFGSLIVRSSASAARFAGETPDLKALAAEADVDRVVIGTLLRSGEQVQVTAQLVEAPGGTLLTSHSAVSSLGDLFRLQHDMARRVVDALALPLTGGAPTPTPEAPQVPHAYELYLRANALGRAYETTIEARDLYLRCVELDSAFAPAWAQLGRSYRVIGKYVDETEGNEALAEQALRRALELSPRLTVAHKYYAMLEADLGRAATAMVRLLGEADRHGNDPELFAGLVHACRYSGLLEQSIAAHHEARRLDPNIATSGQQSVLMTCDIERLLAFDRASGVGGDEIIRVVGLGLAGRRDEARREHAKLKTGLIPAFRPWNQFLLAWIDRRPADMRAVRPELGALRIMDDPEAIFQEAWMFCDVGDHDHGLELLERAVSRGYFVASTLEMGTQFDPLRDRPAFQRVLDDARAGRDAALAAFREHGGERILGG